MFFEQIFSNYFLDTQILYTWLHNSLLSPRLCNLGEVDVKALEFSIATTVPILVFAHFLPYNEM